MRKKPEFCSQFVHRLSGQQFDVARGILGIFEHFKIFTKKLEGRSCATLSFIPEAVDKLLSKLEAGAEVKNWSPNLSNHVAKQLEDLQERLRVAVKRHFAWVFKDASLPLACCL